MVVVARPVKRPAQRRQLPFSEKYGSGFGPLGERRRVYLVLRPGLFCPACGKPLARGMLLARRWSRVSRRIDLHCHHCLPIRIG